MGGGAEARVARVGPPVACARRPGRPRLQGPVTYLSAGAVHDDSWRWPVACCPRRRCLAGPRPLRSPAARERSGQLRRPAAVAALPAAPAAPDPSSNAARMAALPQAYANLATGLAAGRHRRGPVIAHRCSASHSLPCRLPAAARPAPAPRRRTTTAASSAGAAAAALPQPPQLGDRVVRFCKTVLIGTAAAAVWCVLASAVTPGGAPFASVSAAAAGPTSPGERTRGWGGCPGSARTLGPLSRRVALMRAAGAWAAMQAPRWHSRALGQAWRPACCTHCAALIT